MTEPTDHDALYGSAPWAAPFTPDPRRDGGVPPADGEGLTAFLGGAGTLVPLRPPDPGKPAPGSPPASGSPPGAPPAPGSASARAATAWSTPAAGSTTSGTTGTGHAANGSAGSGHAANGPGANGHAANGSAGTGHAANGSAGSGHAANGPGANGQATGSLDAYGYAGSSTGIHGTSGDGYPSDGTGGNGSARNGHVGNGYAANGHPGNGHPGNGVAGTGVSGTPGAGIAGRAGVSVALPPGAPMPVRRGAGPGYGHAVEAAGPSVPHPTSAGGTLAPRRAYPGSSIEPHAVAGGMAPRMPAGGVDYSLVDYDLVAALQADVSRMLIDELRGEAGLSNADRRRLTVEYAESVVRRNIDARLRSGETGAVTRPEYEIALRHAVAAHLIGLGRLQPLIDDPEVENIMVLGTRVRVVYANGVVDEDSFVAAASDEELISLLQRLAERAGQTERSLSTAKPILHLRLPDGARLTVIYVVTARPVVVIRRHRVTDVSMDDLVSMGALTPVASAFIKSAVAAHMNIMIAGRANAGKTTLLRAIADEIPREEWFAVMETVGELGLDKTGRHPWAVCFEEREGFGEKGPDGRPDGQLTIDDLFPHMLRLSATRVIVGEVRAAEIVAMFDAMNTTYGSLCTIHARDEHGVFDRLAELLLRYGASKNREGAYLTIGNAIDLVVYMNMEERPGQRPRRYVSSIMEVHGLGEGRQLSRSHLFAPGPDGLAVPTSVRPSERRAAELQRCGFDVRWLLTPENSLRSGVYS